MKLIKRAFLTLLVVVLSGVLLRGWVYRSLVDYKSLGVRTGHSAKEGKLIYFIDENGSHETSTDLDAIIKRSLAITSKNLNFTFGKSDTDPNKLIFSKKAHCVGYASFYAATCNYLLEKHKLSHRWIATPQMGQIYLLGINLHQYFDSAFFKDHDFVIIENTVTGERFAVDPTVNDYLGIDFITYTNE